METLLKPAGDTAFEDIKEEIVDDENNFEDQPEYIENLGLTNPEEQYHKFLLTQQSTFEEALQKPIDEEDEEEENKTNKSNRNNDLLEESFGYEEAAVELSTNEPKESSRNTFYPDQENSALNVTKEMEEVEHIEPENLFKKSISIESATSKKSQNIDFNNSNSQDSEIANIQNQDEEKSAHLGESQQFSIEQNKNSKAEMDFEKSMEFDQDHHFSGDQQNESFTKTIRSSSFEPKKSRSASFSSSTRRLANSADFKKRSTSNLNNNFALHSTNDFKYMGDQFKVGKTNPNAISHTEQMFQRLYKKKLQYLYEPKYINYNILQTTQRPDSYTNDAKYSGIQFRTGKFASSAVHDKNDGSDLTFEQKFQMMFKQKLGRLAPNQTNKCISYTDLKKMHENLLAKPYY